MIPCQLIHKYSPLLTDHIFAFVCKMWLYPPGQMCRSLSHLRIQSDHLPEGFEYTAIDPHPVLYGPISNSPISYGTISYKAIRSYHHLIRIKIMST